MGDQSNRERAIELLQEVDPEEVDLSIRLDEIQTMKFASLADEFGEEMVLDSLRAAAEGKLDLMWDNREQIREQVSGGEAPPSGVDGTDVEGTAEAVADSQGAE